MSQSFLDHLQPRQGGLSLLLNLRQPVEEHAKAIKAILLAEDAPKNTVAGLNQVGTVHFLRFLLINNDTQFMTITTFDGDFERYVRDFAVVLNSILNPFFAHVEGSDDCLPIQKNPEEFLAFVRKYTVPNMVWYSAYPTPTALEIRKHFEKE